MQHEKLVYCSFYYNKLWRLELEERESKIHPLLHYGWNKRPLYEFVYRESILKWEAVCSSETIERDGRRPVAYSGRNVALESRSVCFPIHNVALESRTRVMTYKIPLIIYTKMYDWLTHLFRRKMLELWQ